jgi:hypothetical protein
LTVAAPDEQEASKRCSSATNASPCLFKAAIQDAVAGMETGEEFGEGRRVAAMRAGQSGGAAALVQSVIDAVADFSKHAREDDVTVVALRGVNHFLNSTLTTCPAITSIASTPAARCRR